MPIPILARQICLAMVLQILTRALFRLNNVQLKVFVQFWLGLGALFMFRAYRK